MHPIPMNQSGSHACARVRYEMARDNRLRPDASQSPATSGRFALLRSPLVVRTAAILAFTAAPFLAVDHLAGLGGGRSQSEPAFLTKELGAPQRSISLV